MLPRPIFTLPLNAERVENIDASFLYYNFIRVSLMIWISGSIRRVKNCTQTLTHTNNHTHKSAKLNVCLTQCLAWPAGVAAVVVVVRVNVSVLMSVRSVCTVRLPERPVDVSFSHSCEQSSEPLISGKILNGKINKNMRRLHTLECGSSLERTIRGNRARRGPLELSVILGELVRENDIP